MSAAVRCAADAVTVCVTVAVTVATGAAAAEPAGSSPPAQPLTSTAVAASIEGRTFTAAMLGAGDRWPQDFSGPRQKGPTQPFFVDFPDFLSDFFSTLAGLISPVHSIGSKAWSGRKLSDSSVPLSGER